MTRVRPGALVGFVVALGALAAGCSAGGMSGSAVSTASSSAPTTAPTSSTSPRASRDYAAGRHLVSYQVNGVRRTAVVVVPNALSHPAPLVFVFHGPGGSGPNLRRRFDIEGLWR